jgi:hypothetical protein
MPSSLSAGGIHEDGCGGSVGGLRGVAGGDCALRVEDGLELGEGGGRGVGARAFVGGEHRFSVTTGFPAFSRDSAGDRDRDQLVGEAAGGLCGDGLLVAGESEGVLIFARRCHSGGRRARR